MSFMDILKVQFPTEEDKEEELNEVKEEMEVLEPQTLSSLKTNSELMGYYTTIKDKVTVLVDDPKDSVTYEGQDPLSPKERMSFDIPLKGITEAKIRKIVLGALLESIKAKVKRYSEGTVMQPKEKEVVAEEIKIPSLILKN